MCNSYYLRCIATSFDSPNFASNARAAGTHKCISPVHQSSQQYATVGKWSKKCIFCWTLQTSYWQISPVWLSSEEWTTWNLRTAAQKYVGDSPPASVKCISQWCVHIFLCVKEEINHISSFNVRYSIISVSTAISEIWSSGSHVCLYFTEQLSPI